MKDYFLDAAEEILRFKTDKDRMYIDNILVSIY